MPAVALAAKPVCKIELLALLGQWQAGWLAGAGQACNPVCRLLSLLGKPGAAVLLLATMWRGAPVARISICARIGWARDAA